MNEIEYKNKLAEIERVSKQSKYILAQKYAFSNTSVQIGDIVEDHIGRIKVERIKFCIMSYNSLPDCVFQGIIINKNGSSSKKNTCRDVYQFNLKQQEK
jgi:hypothetical protein